jgi:hypothetical protein
MFLLTMSHKENQPCAKTNDMPWPTTFLEILTRDEENPHSDGIKVSKLQFIFNYFDIEQQREIAGLGMGLTDCVMFKRIGMDEETY